MCCNLKKGQRKSAKKGHAILTQFITLLLIHIDTLAVLYKMTKLSMLYSKLHVKD